MMQPTQKQYVQDVFVEQSAFIAFMDSQQSQYSKARSFFLDLDDLERGFVTSNYVISTVHQWLRDHYPYKHAEYFLDIIEQSMDKGKLAVIPGNMELEQEAKVLLIQHPHLELSLDEAVTTIILLNYQIGRIFSFNPVYHFLNSLHPELRVIPGH